MTKGEVSLLGILSQLDLQSIEIRISGLYDLNCITLTV